MSILLFPIYNEILKIILYYHKPNLIFLRCTDFYVKNSINNNHIL